VNASTREHAARSLGTPETFQIIRFGAATEVLAGWIDSARECSARARRSIALFVVPVFVAPPLFAGVGSAVDHPELPATEAEFEDLVSWLRAQDDEALLILSGARRDFEDSAFQHELRRLKAPWVNVAIARVAVAESRSILKAIFVDALASGYAGRQRSPDIVEYIEPLLVHYQDVDADPYDVGSTLAIFTFMLCSSQSLDYVGMIGDNLERADNPSLLLSGYSFIHFFPAWQDVVRATLVTHPHSSARIGAYLSVFAELEEGGITTGKAALWISEAVADEPFEMNRGRYLRTMLTRCGEEGRGAVTDGILFWSEPVGVQAIHSLVDGVDADVAFDSVRGLMSRMESESELGRDLVARELVKALGVIRSSPPESLAEIGKVLADRTLGLELRRRAVESLRTVEFGDDIAARLAILFADDSEDGALRSEALSLVVETVDSRAIDVRAVALRDVDPAVRARAVELGALGGFPCSRDWLFAILEDPSAQPDVQEAALAALARLSRYVGDRDGRTSAFLDRHQSLPGTRASFGRLFSKTKESLSAFDPEDETAELVGRIRLYREMAHTFEGEARIDLERRASRLEALARSIQHHYGPG